jgi:hypothetical protein
MEPYFLLALSALGALILLMVGWAVSLLKQQSKTQNDQGIVIAELRALLLGVNGTPGLVTRVNSLHEWRNELQARELQHSADEIARLQEELRLGAADRRKA